MDSAPAPRSVSAGRCTDVDGWRGSAAHVLAELPSKTMVPRAPVIVKEPEAVSPLRGGVPRASQEPSAHAPGTERCIMATDCTAAALKAPGPTAAGRPHDPRRTSSVLRTATRWQGVPVRHERLLITCRARVGLAEPSSCWERCRDSFWALAGLADGQAALFLYGYSSSPSVQPRCRAGS